MQKTTHPTYEAVIGLEVHVELQTQSKMFCACPVLDSSKAEPNTAVCPVCAGMPGALPVINARAVEYGVRVALALNCEVNLTSIFARKNYFYPDLPKGYQISQYEQPLARRGFLPIHVRGEEKVIRIRRVHLEEDTGKLTHVAKDGVEEAYSLVDLNRAGLPLLEIVTEPDFRTPEEVRTFAMALRSILRYLEVNSGDLEKGVMRIEPNVSVRPSGSTTLGTRTEIKNLNSFRAIERGVAYEILRHIEKLRQGETIRQETVGWDEQKEATFVQRVKEGEDDYRYFPEPDLPPLVLDPAWIERVRQRLPELPGARMDRFQQQYNLSEYDASVLVAEKSIADYYEDAVAEAAGISPKTVANWITGELFSLLRQSGESFELLRVTSKDLAALLQLVGRGEISAASGKEVLAEMYATGEAPQAIVDRRGLSRISDEGEISKIVAGILEANPQQVRDYQAGKETILEWFFGQVMRQTRGKADPQVVRQELEKALNPSS